MWIASLACTVVASWSAGRIGMQDAVADPAHDARRAIELPDGPLARALDALPPTAPPAAFPAHLGRRGQVPGHAAGIWNREGTWITWAALVDAESRATTPDPARRAELALLALEQERWDDAWRELELCAATPGWLAALLPRFLPGAPAGSPAAGGARTGTLPEGVTLSPSLPPRTRATPPGGVDRRAMRIDELAIGDAVVELTIAVEGEGVQIDIRHRRGGASRFMVRIPEPAEFAITQEYVDWYQQDVARVAHEIEVRPGDETHTLYGRFEPRALRWTTQLPTQLSAQLRVGTLWITVEELAAEQARAREVAASLQAGPLKLAARVLGSGEAPGENEWTGVRFDLRDATERDRKLAWLASSVERFAFGAARPR